MAIHSNAHHLHCVDRDYQMSLTHLKSGLRNEGSLAVHRNAHHLLYVDRHYKMNLTHLKSGLWNEGSPW